MCEPSNMSANACAGTSLTPPQQNEIKSETLKFADDFCKVLLANFTPKQVHEIVIEIKNFEVVTKKQVEVPDQIKRIVKCFNPNCITNVENVASWFTVVDKKEMKLLCHYCEKITSRNSIVFK